MQAFTRSAHLSNICSTSYTYTCENGTPIPGNAPSADLTGCSICSSGFVLSGTGTDAVCVSDRDNDDVADTTDNCPDVPNADDQSAGLACDDDIDDDNDGLIEIWSLEHLHNMRYNLDGSSYKTTEAGTGDTTGAPTAPTADCTVAVGGVYLCGYELAQNLDFDLDGDGASYTGDGALDDGDNAEPYFVTSAGGWEPIGTRIDPFVTIFDGGGYTIRNLAIRRDQTNIALFGVINTGAHIRNVGLAGALIDYSGSSGGAVYVGHLVGLMNNGAITASYAAGGNVKGGEGDIDYVGGLVGLMSNGAITASYAAGGSVEGGAGSTDYVGGLVGSQLNGTITASHTAVDVDGGEGDSDHAGGLVGNQLVAGAVTASYAAGSVTGGGGDRDRAGGLVGDQSGGTITASYATGDVDGGAGTGDRAGALTGRQSATISASYGFGEPTGGESAAVSTKPAGVDAATGLTAVNAARCSDHTYTTETACTAATLTIAAGTWDANTFSCSPPGTNPTAGVDYTAFSDEPSCTSPTAHKVVETWTTWSNAGDGTLDAWIFAAGKSPRLRYADYDGSSGSAYACSLFPAGVTCGANGGPLPGQPAQ